MNGVQKDLLLVLVPFCLFFCLVTLFSGSIAGFVVGLVVSVSTIGLNYLFIGCENLE